MRTDREPFHRRLLPAVVSDEGHRVTRLELFFDLAYVFAFIQVTRLMAQEHNALGILQALIIVALLWWSWTAYAWLANHAHADERGVDRAGRAGARTVLIIRTPID